MIIISINIVVNELKGFFPFLLAKGKWLVNWYGIEVEKMCKRTFNISKNFSLYYF